MSFSALPLVAVVAVVVLVIAPAPIPKAATGDDPVGHRRAKQFENSLRSPGRVDTGRVTIRGLVRRRPRRAVTTAIVFVVHVVAGHWSRNATQTRAVAKPRRVACRHEIVPSVFGDSGGISV